MLSRVKVLLAAEQPTTRAIPSKEVQDLQYTYKSLGPHSGEASNNLFSLLFKRNKLNILKKLKKKCWIDFFFFSAHLPTIYILTDLYLCPKETVKISVISAGFRNKTFILSSLSVQFFLSFCGFFLAGSPNIIQS